MTLLKQRTKAWPAKKENETRSQIHILTKSLQSSPSQHNIVRKRNPSCAQEQFVFFFVFVSNVSGVEFVSLLLVYLIFDTFCFAFCQWKQYKGHLFIRVSKYVIPVQFKPPSNKSTSRLNLIYPFVWHNKVVIPAPLWSLCWK